jgi:hypothetical protein
MLRRNQATFSSTQRDNNEGTGAWELQR